jgi:hypothetical protein
VTKLVVEPLKTELEQEFNFKLEGRCILAAIAPYLYMHNSPAGTFQFSVYKADDLVFMKEFTSAEIKAALQTTDGYVHSFHPMIPINPVFFTKGTYRANLAAIGYTFSDDSYLGWVRQHENVQDELEYTPSNNMHNPLAMRRKILKRGIQ